VLGRPPTYALYGTLANIVNLGFDGIAVALVGRNHPLGAIIASVFFAAMYSGGRFMQMYAGVYVEMVRAVQGIIIVSVAVPEILSIIRRAIKGRKVV